MSSLATDTTHRKILLDLLVGVSLMVLSFGIYAVGLIAPLTPSERLPSLTAILVFFLIPLLLLVFAYRTVKLRLLKTLIAVELLFVLSTGSLLLMFLFVVVRT
jgi:hypothetical protein